MQKIVVGTDTSASADLAVAAAAELARAADAELVVVYVKPPLDAREVFDPGKVPNPNAYLEALASRFDGVKLRTREEAGDPAETICEVAEEDDADVIVVGNRGTHGKKRWFLGSVPNAIVQDAPCSVYIVDTRAAQ
ncbi:MAG: universal stress protein [Actinobacteria bacterium]|nr:universal stress protein [Actinomycetota bacterium]